MEDYEQTWQDFWEPLIADGDFLDNVKRELHDFKTLMDNTSKVYDECTGSHISKPNTPPETVIMAIERHYKVVFAND